MDKDERGQVRAALLEQLTWPATSGEVRAGAEQAGIDQEWADDVVVAASRLPDDGHWGTMDSLWEDLDPILHDIVHG